MTKVSRAGRIPASTLYVIQTQVQTNCFLNTVFVVFKNFQILDASQHNESGA
jgi:hypothetical protein